MKRVRAGIIGCGNISDIYFKAGKRFDNLEIAACADLVKERAEAKAKQHGVPKAVPVKQLLADPSIEVVVNLTVPKAHAEVAMAALEAGKHVYTEKPLGLTREEGGAILALAEKKGLLVGCAPDTFLGAGGQTARKALDDGWIGAPVAATAFMQCHGHESWHPDPEFYYELGGGPMFDMGPYYLTMLVHLFGPVKRVAGSARVTFPERVITSEKKYGKRVSVETPTHVAGTIEFACGAIAAMVTSFDVWRATPPPLEVHGTEGSMQVPDPNCFGGAVQVFRPGADDWKELPHSHIYADNSRGLGVADMAAAIRTGRPHRASGVLAFHVLDVMQAFLDSSQKGRHVAVRSTCARPAALPLGLRPGAVD